jgi:hypothetical protein
MLAELNKDKKFTQMIAKQIVAIINHLFDHNYHFGVLCRIDHVTFSPELSDDIKKEFRPLTLFFLAGYTFESASIDNDYLYFEAGFGPENLGSQVSVPIKDIIQIIIDETPIFVNSTTKHVPDPSAENSTEETTEARENSFAALMSNPENQKLFKMIK